MGNLTEILARHADLDGGRVAMSDNRQSLSRADLARWVAGAAADLAGGPETIGIFGENGVEWAIAFLAASAAGKTVVPVPAFFSKEQCAHLISDAGIKYVLDVSSGETARDKLDIPIQALSCRREAPAPIADGDGGLIIYTSGSTGTPKGVRLCHGQALWSAHALAEAIAATADDKYLSLLPLPMLLEQICGIMIPALVGGTVHYDTAIARSVSSGKAANIADAFDRERPTTSVMVPQLLALYAAQLAATGSRPHESLRFVAVGGAPVPPMLASTATRLGIPVFEGYGLSECSSVVAVNRPGAARAGTVGQPLKGLRVEIEDGEIVVEGPSVMDGYLHGENASHRWRTGDMGELDADGFLTVYGRRDNLIVTPAGRNISPEWVETTLLGDPRIGACVLGQIEPGTELGVLLIPSALGQAWFKIATRDDVFALVAKTCRDLPEYAQPKSAFAVFREDDVAALFTPNGRIRRSAALSMLSNNARISENNAKLEMTS